ncbi:MAG TPA: hypothetical protein VHD95_13890 [Rhizomicrobium sp.]|jgi:hypothetical protein|nr:hypothetical protein [Rhizomicrobium sp.]
MARAAHETPLPKTGEVRHERNKDNKRVDRESKDSFPASDPPSHNSGSAIGAPKKRETPPPNVKEFEEAAKRK